MSIWKERPVSRELPHFALSHDGHESPVALVGPANDGRFGVEVLVPRDSEDEVVQSMIREVLDEIDFYLAKAGGPDPWEYAIYHCGTTSNVYSTVHWSYFEPSGIAAQTPVAARRSSMSNVSTTTAYWYKESRSRKYHDTEDCPMAQYFDKPGSGYKKVTKQSELPEGYTICGRCRHRRRRRPRPW